MLSTSNFACLLLNLSSFMYHLKLSNPSELQKSLSTVSVDSCFSIQSIINRPIKLHIDFLDKSRLGCNQIRSLNGMSKREVSFYQKLIMLKKLYEVRFVKYARCALKHSKVCFIIWKQITYRCGAYLKNLLEQKKCQVK